MHLWPDERPLAETVIYQKLLEPSPTPKSWFYAAFGFQSEGDIFSNGQDRIALYNRTGEFIPDEMLPLTQQLASCKDIITSCPGMTRVELLDLAAANSSLMDRYMQLYTASEFAFVLAPGYTNPFPKFDNILAAQNLFLAGLLIEPDVSRALQEVDRDLAYWRRVLGGTNTLLSKMVAVTGITRGLNLRGYLMEICDPADLAGLPRVAALSPEEISTVTAIHLEMGIDYTVIHDLDTFLLQSGRRSELGVFALLPIKPVATFNLHQQNYAPVLTMANLNTEEFAEVYNLLPANLHAVTWQDLVVNGKGVWILALADATHLYIPYMFRVHDLQALMVLLNLKQEILTSGMEPGEIQGFLNQSTIMNPYVSEEAARWHSETGEILFETQPGVLDENRTPLKLLLSSIEVR